MANQLIICKGDTSPKWLVIYRPPGHVCGQFSRSMIDTLFKVFPAANKSFPPSLASCLAKASGASELSANINANVNVNRTVYKYKYKYKYLYAINELAWPKPAVQVNSLLKCKYTTTKVTNGQIQIDKQARCLAKASGAIELSANLNGKYVHHGTSTILLVTFFWETL